jgi:phage/plasmid-like protein (TIGR03299 family)
MAHDLDRSTGTPAMAYVGKAPWHGLGQKLGQEATLEEWVKAAKLDWELQRVPVQYLVDGKLSTMADRFVLARSDTHAALSVVGPEYKVVQPKEVIEFYRTLVEQQGFSLETAGALNGGRKVWALAKTGRAMQLERDKGDEVHAYLLLATSCDKTLATTAAFTSIRVVCQNTLNMVIEGRGTKAQRQIKVPHDEIFFPQTVQAQLGLLDDRFKSFAASVQKLTECEIDRVRAGEVITQLLRSKSDKPLSQRAQLELATILSLCASAPGQDLKSAKGTAWGLMNAVTYYADHVRNGSASSRLDSAWFGAGASLKHRTWDLLLDLAEQERV